MMVTRSMKRKQEDISHFEVAQTKNTKRKSRCYLNSGIGKLQTSSHICGETHRDATKDYLGSICSFVISVQSSHIPSLLFNHLQIVQDKAMWLKRSVVISITQGYLDSAQLPIDSDDCILCRFFGSSSDFYNLRIYGYHKQIFYLSNCSTYVLLTKDIQISLPDFSEKLQIKKRRNCLGEDCSNINVKDFDEQLKPSFFVTKLTLLQRRAIMKTLALLETSLFGVIGGLLKVHDEYYAVSKTFMFLKRINKNLFTLLQSLRGAILATKPGTGKTLMVIFFFSNITFPFFLGIGLMPPFCFKASYPQKTMCDFG
jgi:hypothetical protein